MILAQDNSPLRRVLSKVFGKDIHNEEFRKMLWSALANTWWFDKEKPDIGYRESFQSASKLIAEFSGIGDYTTYYMCGPANVVCKYVREEMNSAGWDYVRDF